MEKISVIVPFGNNEKTLQRCMDSILDQTLNTFELVMVSDGSQDDSCELVRRAMLMDSRVRLVKRLHGGVSAARNTGLESAEGEYVQFVDADDYIEPDMLEKMYAALQKNRADLVVCNFEHPFLATYIGDRVLDFQSEKDRLCYYQHTFCAHLPWNKLYRRSAITEGFPEGIGYCEDGMFNLANMMNVRRAVTLDKKLYHYCVAPAGEKPSCIGAIAQSDDFYKTKETYWYKRARMLPLSLDILRRHFAPEEIDDFLYVRIFDFMLWELVIFEAAGAGREAVEADLQNILSEPAFMQALRAKGRYGLRFLPLTPTQLDDMAARFVHTYYAAAGRFSAEGCRPFYAALDLFLSYFAAPVADAEALDETDLAAGELRHLLAGDTPEALFISGFLTSGNQMEG